MNIIMSRHALGFILNPYDVPVVYFNPFAPLVLATAPDAQTEENASNTGHTTGHEPAE